MQRGDANKAVQARRLFLWEWPSKQSRSYNLSRWLAWLLDAVELQPAGSVQPNAAQVAALVQHLLQRQQQEIEAGAPADAEKRAGRLTQGLLYAASFLHSAAAIASAGRALPAWASIRGTVSEHALSDPLVGEYEGRLVPRKHQTAEGRCDWTEGGAWVAGRRFAGLCVAPALLLKQHLMHSRTSACCRRALTSSLVVPMCRL